MKVEGDRLTMRARHFYTESATPIIGAPSEYYQKIIKRISAREDAPRFEPSHSATSSEAGNRTKDTSQETRRRLAEIMRGVMPIPTETPEFPLEPDDQDGEQETENDEIERGY